MQARTITAAEALAVGGDAEKLPYRVLNDAGRARVEAFVQTTARNPGRHDLAAWYREAEDAAGDTLPGGFVIIEMSGKHSRSGHPETLHVEDTDFDWHI